MSAALLMCGIVFSSVGFGYVLYGRKQRAPVPLVCGVALMAVPYFVPDIALLVIAGIALSVLPYLFRP
ncbi:MAG: hypothetical protein KKD25_10790 [Gammaproteobacteria bacterium]|jgi:hypothetical protein|nr:hypothetical protein [Gammaproteobacteria bacterium]MBU0770330.1 hypothetical protein [Gammaproteobacteria bacterium]MBU0858004.1 hypothetical protein [Gammaproteobacteria bacterium]MBU1847847.1 hypothetical protein [Gammaproteobacteria bacterium]